MNILIQRSLLLAKFNINELSTLKEANSDYFVIGTKSGEFLKFDYFGNMSEYEAIEEEEDDFEDEPETDEIIEIPLLTEEVDDDVEEVEVDKEIYSEVKEKVKKARKRRKKKKALKSII